jgi:chromosome segregation ATPase
MAVLLSMTQQCSLMPVQLDVAWRLSDIAACVLYFQALQQQAEGLIAAISRNQQSKVATKQDLLDLQQQLQQQQEQVTAVRKQMQQLQEQRQELRQQVAAAEQQLAERERQKQQVAAEVSEKQHALQSSRGECASAQDKLSQVGSVDGCLIVRDLAHQHLACLTNPLHSC